jgi:hypothetical protein
MIKLNSKEKITLSILWFDLFFFHFTTKFLNITLSNLKFEGEITLHILRSWCHTKINKKYVFIYKIFIIIKIMANKP